MDPRSLRPSMRDKALSGLDSIISNILDSDESDELKAKSYMEALTRFRNYSKPPSEKRETPSMAPSSPPPLTPQLPTLSASQRKKSRRRTKRIEPLHDADNASSVSLDQIIHPDSTYDATLWKRSLRSSKADKNKINWISDEKTSKKKKKTLKDWVQY